MPRAYRQSDCWRISARRLASASDACREVIPFAWAASSCEYAKDIGRASVLKVVRACGESVSQFTDAGSSVERDELGALPFVDAPCVRVLCVGSELPARAAPVGTEPVDCLALSDGVGELLEARVPIGVELAARNPGLGDDEAEEVFAPVGVEELDVAPVQGSCRGASRQALDVDAVKFQAPIQHGSSVAFTGYMVSAVADGENERERA
jgi:hypothetical protein